MDFQRLTLSETSARLPAGESVLILFHRHPDGDAVGSTKGLREILRLSYPEKEIVLQNCDFSNYSNAHRVPDTATAVYWEEESIASGSYRTMEVLYGIGNFASDNTGKHLGLSLNVPSVKLNNSGTGYKNNGQFPFVAKQFSRRSAALLPFSS